MWTLNSYYKLTNIHLLSFETLTKMCLFLCFFYLGDPELLKWTLYLNIKHIVMVSWRFTAMVVYTPAILKTTRFTFSRKRTSGEPFHSPITGEIFLKLWLVYSFPRDHTWPITGWTNHRARFAKKSSSDDWTVVVIRLTNNHIILYVIIRFIFFK